MTDTTIEDWELDKIYGSTAGQGDSSIAPHLKA